VVKAEKVKPTGKKAAAGTEKDGSTGSADEAGEAASQTDETAQEQATNQSKGPRSAERSGKKSKADQANHASDAAGDTSDGEIVDGTTAAGRSDRTTEKRGADLPAVEESANDPAAKTESSAQENTDPSGQVTATVDPAVLSAVGSSSVATTAKTSESSAHAKDDAATGGSRPDQVADAFKEGAAQGAGGDSTTSTGKTGTTKPGTDARASGANSAAADAGDPSADGSTTQAYGQPVKHAFGQALEQAKDTHAGNANDEALAKDASKPAQGNPADPATTQADQSLQSLVNLGDAAGAAGRSASLSNGAGGVNATAEKQFAEANGPSIIRAVQIQVDPSRDVGGAGSASPSNGKITLRLDPPEVGALQVAVEMKNGLASVTLVTENPEAARLMTHTLGELRDSLQAAGVAVDRMTVSQAPPSSSSDNRGSGENSRNQNGSNQQGSANGQGFAWRDDESSRREQQRRQMLERLWKKVTGDDVNFLA
jgi:flagellar hook-length control protein FliK